MNLLHGLQGSGSQGRPDDVKIAPYVSLTITREGTNIQRMERTLTHAAMSGVNGMEKFGERGETRKFQVGDLTRKPCMNNSREDRMKKRRKMFSSP
jgi:hypothetical protein